MSRVKIKFPSDNLLYTAIIPVRIGDINYGGHIGNDSVLSVIHEARMQMLAHYGYNEMNAGGTALIMADVMIAYKGEAYYGDTLHVKVYAEELAARSFDLLYHITTTREEAMREIAHAKTGMVCFDYETHKIVSMQEPLRKLLSAS